MQSLFAPSLFGAEVIAEPDKIALGNGSNAPEWEPVWMVRRCRVDAVPTPERGTIKSRRLTIRRLTAKINVFTLVR